MRMDYGYFEEKKLGKPYDVRLLSRLYPLIRPYRLLFFGTICLIVLITLLDLALPFITKIAIDRYIVPEQSDSMPAQNSPAGSAERAVRLYPVDMEDPESQAIVERHPDLFITQGETVYIPFDRLSRLSKEDLKQLRRQDRSGLKMAAAMLLALVACSLVLNFFQAMIMEYAGQLIMHDLRMRLFRHIQRLSISFFTRNPVGRLVTRVTNDVQNMHELFTSVIAFVFKDLFLLVGIAVVLLGIDVKLALISFSVLSLIVVASFKFANLAREAFRELRIRIAEINTHFSETIGGMSVIQLFGQEKANSRRFYNFNHANYLAGMRQIHVFAVFMPIIELLGAVTVALLIFYGGGGVLTGSITLGALVAFISYMRMFFRPIRDIAEKYNVMQNAMASAERIFLILDSDERILESPDGRPVEKIQSVGMASVDFAYLEDEPVLQDVSFDLQAGQSLAIVGPTGSGKTTLINLLMRFYDPDDGSVRINGQDIRSVKIAGLRSRIAIVTQDPFLFSASVRENIALGRSDLTDAQMSAILEASNCADMIERLPEKLDTTLSEGGSSLSSGERQLLSIARAFARDPDLIILDEATSYIDSETEQRIQEALFNLMKGRTAIIIAHRLSTATSADRILVLNRGRIIESGSHPELMADQGFYYRLHQIQN
ncbi:Heterodimeric efflux ABC transporter, permease/ATP-binding subunit 2 [Olavius algarvensis associated proteobacterium Delta 3]|nr:Heterodimeric efflux ABC transporter, permease/ATP-binding subunit 2 [Olavius algarvensis associated proteobacterium Delta 3]CAB5146633.1 Heterodimeric efflux ABC transporter, permease/ATP-binding subunit 2 [Olavius algarvensis associated proteobacterium Delta 3]